jgi:hypothetical protein
MRMAISLRLAARIFCMCRFRILAEVSEARNA